MRCQSLWVHVGTVTANLDPMETLSHLWGSASTALHRAWSGPFVRGMSARMDAFWQSTVVFVRDTSARFKSGSFVRDMSTWFTSLIQQTRALVHTSAYSTRNTLIHWCLDAANSLQRAQARAIAQSASKRAMLQGEPPAVAIPAPTYPDFSRWYSPPPRVSFKLYEQPEPKSSGALELKTGSLASELKYEDFDDAPTAVHNEIPFDDAPTSVYHPIPSRYDSRLSKQA